MKLATFSRAPAARGFTIVELIIALSIFAVLGYSVAVVVGAGHRTEHTVMKVSSDDRELRGSTESLLEDLSCARDSTIAVANLPDGNHEVTLMLPVSVGGAAAWGVYDRTLGEDFDAQNKAGWSVRYTVRDAPTGGGAFTKELVRQVLDDALEVQKERVLTTGLRAGGGATPGFKAVRAGAVWELTLSTQDAPDGKTTTQVFHVHARN